MKTYTKKLAALLLTLLTAITFCGTVSADGDTIEYSQSPCTLRKYLTDKSGTVILTESYNGEPLSCIGVYAFTGSENITEIVIPETVDTIMSAAFQGCYSLKTVNIPNSVKTVSKYTFWDCRNLSKLFLSENTTLIDDGAFWNCESLETLCFTENIQKIGDAAFYNTGLTSAVIPKSVSEIGASAFDSCRKLKFVSVRGSVTEIKKETFTGCSSLKAAAFSEGTVSIADGAFSGCSSLSVVQFPSSLQFVSPSAFDGCVSLKAIRGYKGSYAESYAEQNSLLFIDIESECCELGNDYSAIYQKDGKTAAIIGACSNCGGVIDCTPAETDPNGDTDGNGTVTLDDAILTARYDVGIAAITPEAFLKGNINKDPKLDIADALLTAQKAQKNRK